MEASASSAAVSAVPAPLTPIPAKPIDWWGIVSLIWLAGAAGMLVWQLRRQSQFMADARAGFAGPAVAGFMTPRIVMPADFEDRFDADERQVIIEHETIHIRRNDARINALAALLRCTCWFNPAIHLGAHLMRIDQELACDAAVADRFPRAKAVYASALLKAELAARPLPLGCYWPARSEHPLTRRIEMLKLASPSHHRRLLGAAALAILAAGGGFSAWAARPPEKRMIAAAPLAQAPVSPTSDQLARMASQQPRAETSSPHPIRFEPQQAPAIEKPQLPTPTYGNLVIPPDYDPAQVSVQGTVERIDFAETKYTVFVRASSLSWPNGFGQRADTSLFELPPTNYWGDRDAVNVELKNKAVFVTGFRPLAGDCQPACKLVTTGRGIEMIRPTALPAIATTPDFGAADALVRYNSMSAFSIQGVVQRLEFGQNAFDAYVQSPANAGVPGQLFQVRSEYRLPRADIEKQLAGKVIYVAGLRSRAPGDVVCGSPCGLYATDIRLAGGEIVKPAGEKLINPPQPDHPFAPGDCFKTDAGNPNSDLNCIDDNRGRPTVDIRAFQRNDRYNTEAQVTIDGRIVSTRAEGWVVKVIGFEPANTPGATSGALWLVEGVGRTSRMGEPNSSDVGRRVTTRGYNAKDTSCVPTCRMLSSGSIWLR